MPIHRLTQNPTIRAMPPNNRCQKRRMSCHLAALMAAPKTKIAATANPPANVNTPFMMVDA